jgi:hypothetical protein
LCLIGCTEAKAGKRSSAAFRAYFRHERRTVQAGTAVTPARGSQQPPPYERTDGALHSALEESRRAHHVLVVARTHRRGASARADVAPFTRSPIAD